jgi:hypothetical protein
MKGMNINKTVLIKDALAGVLFILLAKFVESMKTFHRIESKYWRL